MHIFIVSFLPYCVLSAVITNYWQDENLMWDLHHNGNCVIWCIVIISGINFESIPWAILFDYVFLCVQYVSQNGTPVTKSLICFTQYIDNIFIHSIPSFNVWFTARTHWNHGVLNTYWEKSNLIHPDKRKRNKSRVH